MFNLLALILGAVLGGILAWLLDSRLLRRSRLECPGRVSPPETDFRSPEIELPGVSAQADAPAALPARQAAASIIPEIPAASETEIEPRARVESPEVETEAPAIEPPEVEAEAAVRLQMVSCPQNLSRVRGIGSVYASKLYHAGIGTFWQVAHTDDAELARILDLKDFQKVDLAGMKASALGIAVESGSEHRAWDASQPDDFEHLEGIGSIYEGRLYDAGICTYRALASATVEQLAAICKAPAKRLPDYASWIAQASARMAEGK